MANDGVYAHVEGLRELRRDLLRAEKSFGPKLRTVLRNTAEIVASDARNDIPVLTGNAQRSVKGGSSGPNAVVRGGTTKKVPYYGWLDFGGTIRPRGIEIFRPVIKSANGLHNGRYIYPAIKRKMPEAVRYLKAEIVRVLQKGAN